MVNIDPQSEEGARGRRIATGGRGDPVNSDPKEPLIHKKGRGQGRRMTSSIRVARVSRVEK